MMCQCRFINVPHWWGMLQMEEALRVGREGIWQIFTPFSQFCCELKNTLKNKVFNLKSQHLLIPQVMEMKELPPILNKKFFLLDS